MIAFFVPTAGFLTCDSVLCIRDICWIYDRIGDLNQQRFQITAGTGDAGGFHLLVTLVSSREQPAQETKCFAEGNTDISTLISR